MLHGIDQQILQPVRTDEPAGDAIPLEQMFHDAKLANAAQIFLALAADKGCRRTPDMRCVAKDALAMNMQVTRGDKFHIRRVQQ